MYKVTAVVYVLYNVGFRQAFPDSSQCDIHSCV